MTAIAHRYLPLLLAASLSVPALADDDGYGYSPAYARCLDASGGVTADMLDCIGQEITLQDARLNQAYQTAMQSLSPEQQTRLRDAQRLWIKYRDANCGLFASLTGGSIDRINGAGCLLDMTKGRADELAGIAQQEF